MRDSTTVARNALIVDIEHGTVLNAPSEATVTERYIDSHPFVHRSATHVYVGPESEQAAQSLGASGADSVLYEIVGREIGNVYLKRAAG